MMSQCVKDQPNDELQELLELLFETKNILFKIIGFHKCAIISKFVIYINKIYLAIFYFISNVSIAPSLFSSISHLIFEKL